MGGGWKSHEGVPIITLDEYKNLDNNEKIFLAVKPDGEDFRPCVREMVKIGDALNRDIIFYVNYRLIKIPTDRLRELSEKQFFLKAYRIDDERKKLAENTDARIDILTTEWGISEEAAVSAEVFLHDVGCPEEQKVFENHVFDKDNKTLYAFGASQFIDLMHIPEFKHEFLETAKKNGFNVSLNLRLGVCMYNIINDIMAISLNPGDRVMFTLCPEHLSLIKNRENIIPAIIELKNRLEKRGVKVFIYLFPILNNKAHLSPYEKLIPPASSDLRFYIRFTAYAGEEKVLPIYKKRVNDFDEFILANINRFAASGVRFFYNRTLTASDKTCFLNVSHYTRIGNKILGDEISDLLNNSDFLNKTYEEDFSSPVTADIIEEADKQITNIFLGINEYTADLVKFRMFGKCGAIVMNCNPVTNGHMYLIETAARTVDYLFVFVVEEDRSEFPFEERLSLVRENCKELEKVMVLPSGKFIISQLTFPEYFMKADKSELEPSGKPSVINDVTAFAVKIAVALNIKVRFAGEEPLDPVTREYNRVMANLLPFYGVEFVEIKRKETDGEVISASRVRKLLHEGNFEAIKPLVPNATFRYLTERQKNGYLTERQRNK